MLYRKLVKMDEIEIEGRTYPIQYFEATTVRGTQRYSSELVLKPADRIILDGSSLSEVEWRVARLVPATVYSRALAARTVEAQEVA
jgi:hypothetical protein